ncbi:MAG: S8 family serine peptidase [Tepidisphaeraceae bacterium]
MGSICSNSACGLRLLALISALTVSRCFGAGGDVLRIHGDDVKNLLGDGTNVVVGIVDSGVDDLHPALVSTDSLGRPRMIAEANFVPTEPTNTGDDVYGHGTAVMGTIGLRSTSYFAVGTDTRYVNARTLNSTNGFNTDAWVANALGFAVSNGANLINASLNYGNTNTSGNSYLSLLTDYITYSRRIPITISGGNNGTAANHLNQGPADAYNVFSVAATASSTYNQVATFSSYGPTTDGRSKPDIAAPGQSIVTANDDWEGGTQFNSWTGTSFAAPNTAGFLAGQMEAAERWGYSRDPLVLKATLMNSAEKVARRDGTAWTQVSSTVGGVITVASPVDRDSGAGQINGTNLYKQYVPGNVAPQAGTVDPVGWNLNTISSATPKDYNLGTLAANMPLTATLNWYRKVGYTDTNANGTIDSADTVALLAPLSNLSLDLYRNGVLYAQSVSPVDNVEHLYFPLLPAGTYMLRVRSDSATTDDYALAWSAQTLPGDFNSDGVVNAADIDLLMFSTQGDLPTARPKFDLNGDRTVKHSPQVSASDADVWVQAIKLTRYGDANLDGKVNFDDLLTLASNYGASSKKWADGSFDGDGLVNFSDLLQLASNYGFGVASTLNFAADWARAQSMVPEPATLALLAAPVLSRRPRRR